MFRFFTTIDKVPDESIQMLRDRTQQEHFVPIIIIIIPIFFKDWVMGGVQCSWLIRKFALSTYIQVDDSLEIQRVFVYQNRPVLLFMIHNFETDISSKDMNHE